MALATPAHAAIVSGAITGGTALSVGGTYVQLSTSAPFTVGSDNFNTNNFYGFDEQQGITLTANLLAELGLTTIAAGTRVNSHFLFLDPAVNRTLQATITFDTPVISAMILRPSLVGSNFLGAANVTYLTPASLGLEPGTDFVTPGSPSANQLRINFLSPDTPGDHFRVLTLAAPVSVVPEPGTWFMMIAGLGILGAAFRRSGTGIRLISRAPQKI